MAELDFDDVERRERENRTLLQRLSGLAFGTPAPRPDDQEVSDEARKARIATTMRAFLAHREAYVRAHLVSEKISPETTYALTEAIHAYFRHRQILLSSDELRELAAPVIAQWASTPKSPPAGAEPAQANEPEGSAVPVQVQAQTADADSTPPEQSQPLEMAPPPETPPAPPTVPTIAVPDYLRVVHDATAGAIPSLSAMTSIVARPVLQSRLQPHNDEVNRGHGPAASTVATAPSGTDQEDALIARCMGLVEGTFEPSGLASDRPKVLAAIDAALDQMQRELVQPLPAETREKLFAAVAGEILGLSVVGRIWEDASVQSIYVNGAHSIFVERSGTVVAADLSFRDDSHLLSFVKRLGVANDQALSEVRLPNGGKCIAIFPPASPSGPIFTFHRGTAAGATLPGLVAADMIDDRIASLLRLAATAGLTTAVVGARSSGKTTLLSALCTDLGDKTRVVTVSRSRELLSDQRGRVELVASEAAPLPTLLRYAQLIGPEVLVVDGADSRDITALNDLDRSTMKGLVVAIGEDDPLDTSNVAADLVVRMGRGRDAQLRVLLLQDSQGDTVLAYEDGRFKLKKPRPAFTEKVRAIDQAAGLARLMS